ncbi:hypothetical protein [Streptomyces sp. NPDC085466]|uniref:hypothetical protein n=1 Tax=Streptomyces sp. NPDC085466 TaxID=3365725 RepID=UPI0037D0B136
MRRAELIQLLMAETGGLRPGVGTTQSELAELRATLVRAGGSIAGGVGSRRPPSRDDALRAEMDYLVGRQLGESDGPDVRVVRRASPLPGLDVTVPAWASAARPDRSFGPFEEADGRPVWFDMFRPAARWFLVRVGAAGPVLAALPPPVAQRPHGGTLVGDISPGTVWVAARRLAPGAPAQGWVGLQVRGGTIEVGGAIQSTPGQLAVANDARIALTLDLESAPPSGTAEDGAGAEAVATVCQLPRTATLRIRPDGPGAVGDLDASLSVYGQEIALRRRSGAPGPPAYGSVGSRVLVPLAATPDRLTVAETQSTLFSPSGTAPIRKAHWSLPVTTDPIDLLGEVPGCGRVALDLAPGLRASWYGLEGGPVSLGWADLFADGTSLHIEAVPAETGRARQVFRLWEETAQERSRVEVTFPKPFALSYVSHTSGADEFITHGLAHPWLDRPRTAAGQRVDTSLWVMYRLVQGAAGIRLALDSEASDDGTGEQRPCMALAVSNALLTVAPPRGLRLDGPLAGPGRLDSGELSLPFLLRHLLPTLPDPYAANFHAPTTRPAHHDVPEVWARVLWSTPSESTLSLGVVHDGPGEDLPAELVPAPEALPLETEDEHVLLTSFEEWLGARQRRSGLALLDVSSFADQLGVTITFTAGQRRIPLTVDDLALRTAAENTLVFLLPQFQWEPVRNLANPLTGDQEDVLTFGSDGGPTLMGTRSVTLVPFTPVPVARELVRAHEEDDAPAAVLFTLPFGMHAVVWLDPSDQAFKEPATLGMLRARFPGLTGVRRLSLRAGVPHGTEHAASGGSPPPAPADRPGMAGEDLRRDRLPQFRPPLRPRAAPVRVQQHVRAYGPAVAHRLRRSRCLPGEPLGERLSGRGRGPHQPGHLRRLPWAYRLRTDPAHHPARAVLRRTRTDHHARALRQWGRRALGQRLDRNHPRALPTSHGRPYRASGRCARPVQHPRDPRH